VIYDYCVICYTKLMVLQVVLERHSDGAGQHGDFILLIFLLLCNSDLIYQFLEM